MNFFIKQLTLFIAVVVVAFVSFTFIKYTFYIKPYIVNENTNTIIVGDSHVQYAINDSLIPGYKNISLNSEGYIYSYSKIKNIIKYNPHVKNVFLGFSYHNLSSYFDNYITGDFAQSVMPRYIEVIDLRESLTLIWTSPHLIRPALKALISTRNNYSYIGAFPDYSNFAFNKESMQKMLEVQYFSKGELRGISDINKRYFTEIVKLCNNYGVNLTLINTPLHNDFLRKIPNKYINEYNSILGKYRIQIIDFKGLELTNNCFLPDGSHLNTKGALLTTEYFKKIVKDTRFITRFHK